MLCIQKGFAQGTFLLLCQGTSSASKSAGRATWQGTSNSTAFFFFVLTLLLDRPNKKGALLNLLLSSKAELVGHISTTACSSQEILGMQRQPSGNSKRPSWFSEHHLNSDRKKARDINGLPTQDKCWCITQACCKGIRKAKDGAEVLNSTAKIQWKLQRTRIHITL